VTAQNEPLEATITLTGVTNAIRCLSAATRYAARAEGCHAAIERFGLGNIPEVIRSMREAARHLGLALIDPSNSEARVIDPPEPPAQPDTTLSVAEAMRRIGDRDMTEMCLAVNSMFGTAKANKLLALFGAARREAAKEVDAMTDRTMRDKIAAIVHENTTGALSDYDIADDVMRGDPEIYEASRATADAIIAAMPGMLPDLQWEKTTGHWQASDRLGGRYEVFRLSGGRSTAHHLVSGYGVQIGDGSSMGSDISAANAHHRAAMCKALGWKP